jgi:hypothetical protein
MGVKSATARGLSSSLEPGLVLLNTQTFSAVSSVSLPANTFTATYENYNVIFAVSGCSADASVTLRLRAAGVDASGGNYDFAYAGRVSNGTDGGNNASGGTQFDLFQTDAGNNSSKYLTRIDFYRPQLTDTTQMLMQQIAITNTGLFYSQNGGGLHGLATSYDSASFNLSTGTFSGKVTVYGYNQ